MKVNILGGGPAGLYFAILLKKQDPAHDITVIERDGPNDTFGWGIVFSETTLDNFALYDRETYNEFTCAAQKRDAVIIQYKGETIPIYGNPISGVSRLIWLQILHKRCRELGIELRFHENVTNVADYADCDLLVGADGANSLVRKTYEGFLMPSIEIRQNKFIWLGTEAPFEGLTMMFRETEAGLFIAHSYRFSETQSTFIVECPPETWLAAGLDRMGDDETVEYLAYVFREELGGHALLHNNFVRWLNFPLVKTRKWYHKNIVLLGDALHTAHFSIGSGTKLAMEDSIALADAFARCKTVEMALPEFQRVRKPVIDRFQTAALRSLTWLEQVQKYMRLPPLAFAYKAMTRSQRVSFKRVEMADPEFAHAYEAWKKAQPKRSAIPDDFVDLFNKKAFGHLATIMADGTPHVTSVYVDWDGKHVLVNSARGRVKDKNMQERPNVALQIPDPDNSDRYISVRGRVVEITEEGAEEHLNKLSQRYIEKDVYPPSMRFPGEVRAIYKILPEKVIAWSPWGG